MRNTVGFFLLLTSLCWATGLSSQVKFKAGQDMVTLKGAVVHGDRDTYSLGAVVGQDMIVTIQSPENNAVFQIYGPSGKPLPHAGESDDAKTFTGRIPSNGNYKIVVGPTRGNATYKLRIKID